MELHQVNFCGTLRPKPGCVVRVIFPCPYFGD
jgi:hypothetical protein